MMTKEYWTTDFSGRISDYTIDELKKADAGYMFKDGKVNFYFCDKGEKSISLRELLTVIPRC